MNKKIEIFIKELEYYKFFDNDNNLVENDMIDLFLSFNIYNKEDIIKNKFIGIYICPLSHAFLLKTENDYLLLTPGCDFNSNKLDFLFEKLFNIANELYFYDDLKLKQLKRKIERF